jgi:peptide/nickel transport system permease protein
MGKFIVRRLALSLVTLFILLIIVFMLTSVFPGDPARTIAGPFASDETYLDIRDRIGVDDPKIVQFTGLLKDTVTFDFGDSFELDTPVDRRCWWRSR